MVKDGWGTEDGWGSDDSTGWGSDGSGSGWGPVVQEVEFVCWCTGGKFYNNNN